MKKVWFHSFSYQRAFFIVALAGFVFFSTGCLQPSVESKDTSNDSLPIAPVTNPSDNPTNTEGQKTCSQSTPFTAQVVAQSFFRNPKIRFHAWSNIHWFGPHVVFDNLDQINLQDVQLTNEVLIVEYVALPHQNIDPRRLVISLNSFRGSPIANNAMEFTILKKESIYPRWRISEEDLDDDLEIPSVNDRFYNEKSKKQKKHHFWNWRFFRGHREHGNHSRRHTDFSDRKEIHDVYFVRVKIHLEKFVFGEKFTAADIIRKANDGLGRLIFKLHGFRSLNRIYKADLTLSGNRIGSCEPPGPTDPPPSVVHPIARIESSTETGLTKNSSIQIHFSSDQPGEFQCSLDSNPFVTCLSPFTASGLTDGLHNFSVKAIGTTGLQSEPVNISWTVDTTVPQVSLGSISPSEIFTSLNSILINYTANEAVTFSCRHNLGVWANCQPPFTQSDLTDGDHVFAVRATDMAGNVSAEVSYSWTVKTSLPTVILTSVIPATNPSHSTSRLIYFESGDVQDKYLCSLDSGIELSCTSPYQLSNLADGGHVFSVISVDRAGNRSQPAIHVFSVDTIAPEAILTGISPSLNPTNASKAQFYFASNETVTWSCSLDGIPQSSCVSPVQLTNLSEGSHRFQILATDMAGNVSSPRSYEWSIDTTPPVQQLISTSPAQSIFNQEAIDLNFQISEPSISLCTIDQDPPVDCSLGGVRFTGLKEGSHTISIISTDLAGNQSIPLTHNFSIDMTAPALQITNVLPTELLTQQNQINISFSADTAAEYLCSLNGSAFTTCASPVQYSNLNDGHHEFFVQAKDGAGNISTPVGYAWDIDTTAPDTALISSTVNQGTQTSLTSITLSFNSNELNTHFICQLDNMEYQPCSSPLSYSGLSDGSHIINIMAVDVAGNTDPTPVTISWVIDTTPLVLSGISITNVMRNSVVLNWTTNKPSTTQAAWVIYSSSAFAFTTLNSTLVTNHSVSITGLAPSTVYYAYVISVDSGGMQQSSPVFSFKTAR